MTSDFTVERIHVLVLKVYIEPTIIYIRRIKNRTALYR